MEVTLDALMRTRVQFVKFLLVGALNTAFGYGLFAGALWLGLHYAAASAIATVLGILFNFQSTGRLVFDNLHPRQFWRFVLVYAFSFCANLAGLALILHFTDLNAYVVGALLLLPTALLTFILQKKLVFSGT